jgi:subtilisin family serine protease
MRASGTSMAAPAVTNVAAKLMVLHTSLKPTDVIDLIESGADRSADDHRRLINPRHSLALLRAKHQSGAAATAR